jgi:hypothetical protein
MGWLDKLVKPAIRQGDQMEYVDPEQAGVALARAAAATAQPSVADVEGNISEPYMAQGETMGPGPMATPQPDTPEMVQPPDQTTTSYETPQSKQPSIVKPSFEKASTDANGMPAASTPGLTRLGKLFQILGLSAKGALAGRAASERAVAESGGHRGGGFGTGFEAGLTEAPREAAMNQQVERGAMENETARANLAALPWMRAMQQRKAVADLEKEEGEAAKAPYVTPRTGGVFDSRIKKFVKGAEPTEKAGTVDQQVFDSLTSTPDPKLGRPLNPAEAKQRMLEMGQDAKPDKSDVRVGERVGPDNNKYTMFQRPDKTTYEVKLGAERQPANTANAIAPGEDVPTIDAKKQPNLFKIAQDLAYGKLTFQGFRTMYAYSRDAKAKQALYATAGQLNPNFNQAEFEMGYNLAKNPKVQQQLASLDNVVRGMPDLLKASDDASRTGIKKINEIVNWGGAQIGQKKYSNFHTAQVAFADELSGALGYGSATDMSREMGFAMTDPNLSPSQFSSAVRDIIAPFVERKRMSLLNQMGIYGKEGMNPAASAPKTPEEVEKGKGKPPQEQYEGIRFKELQ